jgi:outer membrane receptor for ferrienterochelin and colicins
MQAETKLFRRFFGFKSPRIKEVTFPLISGLNVIIHSASFCINLLKGKMQLGYSELPKIIILILALLFVNNKIYAQDKEIEKLLKLDIENLTDMNIISATKTLNKISEVPATVRVITSEAIKQNGFLTLEDALSNLPGFQFRNILGFNGYVFQRGIPNQNNLALLLVDGIEINELNSGGFYTGGQFNLDNVEQIEIVYGPASALYGTNAISGVINIITKEPTNDRGLHASALIGTFKTYNSSLSYSYYDENEQAGFRISGMYKSSEKADLTGAEGDYNWTSNMENFENDYSFNIKAVYKDFKLGVLYQNNQTSRTTNYKSIGTEYLDKNTLWNIGFLNVFLKHYYSFSETLDINTTFSYRNSTVLDNTVAYITDKYQVGYYRPSHLFSGETIISYSPYSLLKIIGGALFERESLADDYSITYSQSSDQKPPTPQSPKIDNNNLVSLYLQTQTRITNSINLFAGARYDNSTNYGTVLTPRLGLVFNKEKFTIKILYSEAFRAPKPWDYTSGIGNSNLKPEKMNSLEIAGDYYFFNNFHFALSLYKNKLANLITQENANNNYRWINQGDVKTEGAELNIDYQSGPTKAYANYTYNFSTDDADAMLPEIAKHSANVGVVFNPLKDFLFSLRCNYLGKRNNPKIIQTTGNNVVDDAFIVHSSVSYSGSDKFTLSLTVNNLFNEVYFHTSNRPPDRYRQPQRTILFKIEYAL